MNKVFNNFIDSIFPSKSELPKEDDSIIVNPNNTESVTKNNPITENDIQKMYQRPSSFIDRLPWVEFQTESKSILLEDGKSCGAVFDVVPIPTEGRPYSVLQDHRDLIENALQDSFEEMENGQWIIQQYAYDDDNLEDYIKNLRDYVWDHAKGSEFTNEFLSVMESHLRGICKEEGLFYDKEVLDAAWGGKVRKIKLVVYRRIPEKYKSFSGMSIEEELNDAIEKFESALNDAGIAVVRNTGKAFYEWMIKWFNPRPAISNGDRREFMELAQYPGDDDLPYLDDFSEGLFFETPRSDKETQTWWFDDLPHRCIRVHKLRKKPRIGQSCGEVTGDGKGNTKASCMLDRMPPGTILATTIVITPQDEVQNHIDYIQDKAIGDSVDAEHTREDCDIAKKLMGRKHKLYRAMMAVYIRGEGINDLRKKTNQVSSLLLGNNLQPIREEAETLGLDAYIYNLPMCYDPKMDKDFKSTRPVWAQHLANLSSLFGRSRGTGNPGQTMFNRGGEPISFDPFNMMDRKKNGHGLMLGPTGAGKSATITYMISQIMGLIRPRLFVIEAGNSFGLVGDYFANNGLTVNKVALKPGAGVRLPPFVDADKLVDLDDEELLGSKIINDKEIISEKDITEQLPDDFEKLDDTAKQKARDKAALDAIASKLTGDADKDDEENADESRDIMGEMEIIAMLMITGGEEEEAKKVTRADRRMIRDCILHGARTAVKEQRQCMTEDIVNAFFDMSKNEIVPEQRRNRAYEMGEAMKMFTDGFEGELFNQEGELWPDTDVTIIDLATFAREGYGSQLAVAYTSIMMRINNLAEQHQYDERPIIMITDEGHIITTNPLLAPFVVKIVKMWRKLGAWYWVATQNMEDFPNAAKKMLNMIEWWICLVMPQDEIEHIARFKSLSEEQKMLMLSAQKEPKKFTEGVVLSENMQVLFRNVPPSLYLAIAMTEKDEKTERAKYMRKFGITEVEAAQFVSDMLDFYRGISEKPADPVPKEKKIIEEQKEKEVA